MHTDNLTLTGIESKRLTRSQAVEAGKADPDSIRLAGFCLVKSNGLYDYRPGQAGVLLSSDIPQADYYLSLTGQWRHTLRSSK